MKLLEMLNAVPSSGKDYCPDCGSQMKSNGCCPECGYGEEDGGEDDGGDMHETVETQSLLDLRDTLQKALQQIDRMIVANSQEEDSEDPKEEDAPAPQQTIIWTRQR